MIKFFRKIRQKLLVENRFNKYLLYAIGETVLVVIGILIALQINNNNEARKDRNFELKMLKEISRALEGDIWYVKEHLIGFRTKEAEKGVDYYKRLLKEESVDLDSLRHYFDWLGYGIVFRINQGPYQGLKSVGLNKVSNDSVRNQIQLFYDFYIPRSRDLIYANEDRMDEKQKPLKQSLLEKTKYEVKNDSVYFITPLKAGKFWREDTFIEYLRLGELRLIYRLNVLKDFLKYLEYGKEMIDKEIAMLSN